MSGKPRAVQDCHKLIVWMIPQLDKFPRSRRFTLGERLENRLLLVLELLVYATYSPQNRAASLQRANRHLAIARHLWRMAFELKCVARNIYGHPSLCKHVFRR